MPLAEAVLDVRDILEAGGNVLLVIALVTFVMWTGMIERFWYLRSGHPREARRIQQLWSARADHASWAAHQVRRLLVSEVELGLTRGLALIKACVALCPLCGLLGTVFDPRTFHHILMEHFAAIGQLKREQAMNQKWEYYYFFGNTDDEHKSKSTEEHMQELGLQGWELVSVAPSKGQGWGNYLFAFKRPVILGT